MANALDKVMNYMLPNLEGNQMANLLGIDNMRKARGRGLLDAGLAMMALSGPRPATENINPAMIMKAEFDGDLSDIDTTGMTGVSILFPNLEDEWVLLMVKQETGMAFKVMNKNKEMLIMQTWILFPHQ